MPKRTLATGNVQLSFTSAPCGVRCICSGDSGISTLGCARRASRQCSSWHGFGTTFTLGPDRRRKIFQSWNTLYSQKLFCANSACVWRPCLREGDPEMAFHAAARIEVERVLQMAMAVLRQTLFALPQDKQASLMPAAYRAIPTLDAGL